jgi:hypothetical protein
MSIVYKYLVISNWFLVLISSRLISSPKPTLLFIISISYILLSISLISKSNLLINTRSISNIISLSIKLGKRVV